VPSIFTTAGLRAAGLIGPDGHWAAGKTTLVQLGDIVDREPDSLQIIRSLQQLQAEAPKAGGRVVVVLGNHEAMRVLGDNRYTTAGEYAAFADDRSPARREDLYLASRQKIEAAASRGGKATNRSRSTSRSATSCRTSPRRRTSTIGRTRAADQAVAGSRLRFFAGLGSGSKLRVSALPISPTRPTA
jgi:hypothetical protein